jgi:MIP family channel proteins
MKLLPPCVAEFIGTFALCFIGIGAIKNFGPTFFEGTHFPANLLAIALAHGLTIATMVAATLHISGGQLNPAVSIALMATGKITAREGIAFIISQLLGAIAASALLLAIFGKMMGKDMVFKGTPAPDPTISIAAGIVIEAILTFFLVFVIFGTGVDSRGRITTGLAIGLTVALDILFGGPFTGASMNPARTFGPAVIGGQWSGHIIYWIGPIAGAVLAGITYNTFFLRNITTERAVER